VAGGNRRILIPGLIWRDSEAMFTLNFGALLGLAALAAHGSGRLPLRTAGVTDYVLGGLETIGTVAAGPAPVVLSEVRWKELPIAAPARRAVGIGMGFWSPLVLLIFGALLGGGSSSTRDRAGLVAGPGPRVGACCSGQGVGWLPRASAHDRDPGGEPRRFPALATIGFASIGTAVAAVATLLLVFIGFQARTFLGPSNLVGHGSTVASTPGGFFQLVGSRPLLRCSCWRMAPERRAEALRPFRLLAAATLVLLLLILASALHRMRLYTTHFGLTELRLYTTAFMAWLAVVFGWFSVTVLRGRRSQFAPGGLVAALGTLVLLNVANPDAVIARVSLERAAVKGPDATYLATLSADAVPTDDTWELQPHRCSLAVPRIAGSAGRAGPDTGNRVLGRTGTGGLGRDPPSVKGCAAAPE
jgi:hypothetical protein